MIMQKMRYIGKTSYFYGMSEMLRIIGEIAIESAMPDAKKEQVEADIVFANTPMASKVE